MTEAGGDDETKRKPRKSLKKAVAEVAQVREPSPRDREVAKRLDEEAALDRQSSRGLRETYARYVYRYLIGYTIGAFSLIVAHGFRFGGFGLDTPVLALVVGSTAIAAIGLVGIVVKGLFK
jgi:hypothetical protein